MIVLNFFKWIVLKIIGKFMDAHESLREGLRYNTGETLFFWFLAALASSVVELLIVAGISVLIESRLDGWWFVGFVLTLIAHLLYTGVSVMFHCFKQERAELFETIKNGR